MNKLMERIEVAEFPSAMLFTPIYVDPATAIDGIVAVRCVWREWTQCDMHGATIRPLGSCILEDVSFHQLNVCGGIATGKLLPHGTSVSAPREQLRKLRFDEEDVLFRDKLSDEPLWSARYLILMDQCQHFYVPKCCNLTGVK